VALEQEEASNQALQASIGGMAESAIADLGLVADTLPFELVSDADANGDGAIQDTEAEAVAACLEGVNLVRPFPTPGGRGRQGSSSQQFDLTSSAVMNLWAATLERIAADAVWWTRGDWEGMDQADVEAKLQGFDFSNVVPTEHASALLNILTAMADGGTIVDEDAGFGASWQDFVLAEDLCRQRSFSAGCDDPAALELAKQSRARQGRGGGRSSGNRGNYGGSNGNNGGEQQQQGRGETRGQR